MARFPAARIGDQVTHDLLAPSGVIAPPMSGPCPKGKVIIEGKPAAHVGCTAACSGAVTGGLAHVPLPVPAPIAQGSGTVKIHGAPAARWTFSPDAAGCGAKLGSVFEMLSRTVWIGG